MRSGWKLSFAPLSLLAAVSLVGCDRAATSHATAPPDRPIAARRSSGVELHAVHTPQRPGHDAPAAGEDCEIALDTTRRCIWLFGGKDDQDRNTNELWMFRLDSRQWTRVQTGGDAPPPREDHSLVYDPANDCLILFGGEDGKTSSATWCFDIEAAQWRDITHPSAPAREEHVAIYDPRGMRMVVFGGARDADHVSDEVWCLNLTRGAEAFATWSQAAVGEPSPGPRRQHAGVYDPKRHRLIILGGRGPRRRYSNDVWSLDLESLRWSELPATGQAPEPLGQTAIGLDPEKQLLTVFGGEVQMLVKADRESFSVNRVWTLDLESGHWTDRTPYPHGMYDHVGVFVPEYGGMLIYGGSTYRPGKEHTTWLIEPIP